MHWWIYMSPWTFLWDHRASFKHKISRQPPWSVWFHQKPWKMMSRSLHVLIFPLLWTGASFSLPLMQKSQKKVWFFAIYCISTSLANQMSIVQRLLLNQQSYKEVLLMHPSLWHQSICLYDLNHLNHYSGIRISAIL